MCFGGSEKRMRKWTCAILSAVLLLAGEALAAEETAWDGGLRMEDGSPQPILDIVTNPRDPAYSNEASEVLRFCVYVETDNDTDGDGMADLVKALIQVPRGAVEGKYQAGVIYDPTPYAAGTLDAGMDLNWMGNPTPFDYSSLYRACEKRVPAEEMSTMDCALQANPEDWNYIVPGSGGADQGYAYLSEYDYYLMRGYAVVEAAGIGTWGSEGFELCGTHLERDSHRAVVEWLTGTRKAYTDRTNRIEIRADWSNGKVAMTGCSYGGTLPFEVATTGVPGLATIIPAAGIASWYDYTNSQGVPTILDVSYANSLAGYNAGATFLDRDWTVPNREYGSWLWQIAQDQLETNGTYGPVWEESDYTRDWEGIRCSALIVQGLNDRNVMPKHADLMVQAFEKAGQPWRLVLHQDGHNVLDDTLVGGELWNEIMNRWLARWLYGEENDAEDMPAVLAQSNLDGSWKAYGSWRDFAFTEAEVSFSQSRKTVMSDGMAAAAKAAMIGRYNTDPSAEGRDLFYGSLPDRLKAEYLLNLPEGTTVYGVPEVHVRLSSETQDYEGLMITAVLVDTADDGNPFDAYMVKDRLHGTLPVRIREDLGGIQEYVQDWTTAKAVSFGWTDLANPGGGYDSSDYTENVRTMAGDFYDYTFYLQPTVYTVAPGHHLTLILITWDPYRAFLDESFENLNLNKDSEEIDYNYSFVIDNESIRVRIPVEPE